MERRKFLIGVGSAAAAGSALIGSGAFSRVESDRSVTVSVAEDPDAYLGLSKCRPDGENPTPNSSFVEETNDHGHIEIDMGESGNGGSGVNSNSITSFDNVFEIRNQGKERVCVDLRYDPVGIEEDKGDFEEGDPAVVFYQESSRTDQSSELDESQVFDPEDIDIDDPDSAVSLGVGESICIGIQTRTFGIDAEDGPENLLNDINDSQLEIVADVGGLCQPSEPARAQCTMYGIDRDSGAQAIREIVTGDLDDGIAEPRADPRDPLDSRVENIVPNDDSINFPNGLSFDHMDDVWYFSGRDSEYEGGWDDVDKTPDPFESGGGSLYTYDPDADEIVEYGQLADGERVAGAAFDGAYYFVDQGNDNKLIEISVDVGDPDSMTERGEVADLEDILDEADATDMGPSLLGDIAISSDGVAYIAFRDASRGNNFFVSVDLDTGDVTLINEEDVDDPSEATEAIAGGRQIGFGVDEFGNEVLYVHEEANFGSPYPWWVVEDPDNASRDTDDEDFTTAENFTDLSDCSVLERVRNGD